MAITLHLYYTGTGTAAQYFAREMISSGTVQKIREIPGNLEYSYYFPLEEDHTVLLIDRWASQQALDAHHASSMMQTILSLREKYHLQVRAERFQSDESIPESDFRFLRPSHTST